MKYLFLSLVLGLALASQAQRPTAKPVPRPATQRAEGQPARYAQLDQTAHQLPETHATTLDQLAAALAAHARTDDDKARLVFAWIAYHIAYDVASLQGRTPPHVTAEQALATRRAECQGYAELFTALARRMKLPAETVVGYAGGEQTGPVRPVLGPDRAHAWNVYLTPSDAHLADACWGAGWVSEDEFTPAFDAFWFNTPSDQAIFTHWPADAEWQLLAAPVDSLTFRRWPYIAASWFTLGVSGSSMRQGLAPAKGNAVCPPLPRACAPPHEVRIVQVPRQAAFVVGQPVTFVFRVGPGIEVGLEGDGRVLPAEARGEYRRLTVTPAAGAAPRIVTWRRADSTKLSVVLEYDVAPVLRRAGPFRSGGLDSVRYLRR